MGLEVNKAVVRRFIEELWNRRQLEVADDIFAPDCVTHQLRSGAEATMPRPPEVTKQHIKDWTAAFPDLHITIERMIAEKDRVMIQCIQRGTHLGSWQGIAPTGKVISIQMVVVYRIAGGRIAEDWVLVDFLGVFQQLGVVPPTAEIFKQASTR